MTGGLMQLVAYGAQDIYLTGQPVITYFKVVYRRHTNFATESIQQINSGTANFGSTISTLISRNGDLISTIVVEVTLPALGATHRWTDNVGHYIIKQVKVEIGGQTIDTHYADWLEIWAQLTVPAGQRPGYLHMIGQDAKDSLGQPTGLQLANSPNAKGQPEARTLYIPLQFWFCRNVGLALPLIALQYHEVKLHMTIETLNNLSMNQNGARNTGNTELPDLTIWVDYIFLDTDERRRFAQVSHEYLIEQLQYSESTVTGSNANVDLFLNHPVKELVWVCRRNGNSSKNQWNNYTTTEANTSVLPIVNIIPKMELHTLAANRDIWAMPYNTWQVRAGAPVNTSGGLNYTTSLTPIPHAHMFLLNGNTGETNAGGGNHSHTIAIGKDTESGGLTHSHPYYIPHLQTNGSPIMSMYYSADYGNGHLPDVSVNNAKEATPFNTNVAVGHRLRDEANPVTLASVTSAHDFIAGGQLKSDALNPVNTAKLLLNGQDRCATRKGGYFNMWQTTVHTNKPESKGINVYSFAIKPEDHQPSGTCNFSRIDNARLVMNIGITDGVIKIFATNYNVLRIMSGMGGLAYSN